MGLMAISKIAIDAIKASSVPHVLYSPDKSGQMCIYQTHGNPHAHVILRGGKTPNYHPDDINTTLEKLEANDINAGIMVDCSHGNSYKDHNKQINVAKSIAEQLTAGNKRISGVMVESFLVEGNQKVIDKNTLTYGQSITDACIDLSVSREVLNTIK